MAELKLNAVLLQAPTAPTVNFAVAAVLQSLVGVIANPEKWKKDSTKIERITGKPERFAPDCFVDELIIGCWIINE